MTIEQKAGETILQGTETIDVAGKKYEVGKPSVATLIMISELVSTMPEYKDNSLTSENVLKEVLTNAKDMKVIGRISAILILGAKRVRQNIQIERRSTQKSFLSRFLRKDNKEYISEVDNLSEEILYEFSPSELSVLLTSRLSNLDVGTFFMLTTSLMTSNVLKATKQSKS